MNGFSVHSLQLTLYLGISLFIALDVREFARAYVASNLHDPTPRLWGRLTLQPKPWFEPFGSGLLPGLLLFIWAASVGFPPVVAYAKPAPIDPGYLRRSTRDNVFVGLAGPLTNIAMAVAAGIALRVPMGGGLAIILGAFEFANLCVAFFHLLPIPGLDGARLVGLVLPDRAAIFYRNLDAYLPLFVLVVLFILTRPAGLTETLTNSVCRMASGRDCLAWGFGLTL